MLYFSIHAILLFCSYDLRSRAILLFMLAISLLGGYGLRTEVVLFCCLCYFS